MVRYITAGLKTTTCYHYKSIILCDAGLQENSVACDNFFQTFITHKEAETLNVTVAHYHHHKVGKYGIKSGAAKMETSDRYYNKSKWQNLPPEKCKVKFLFVKKGHYPQES